MYGELAGTLAASPNWVCVAPGLGGTPKNSEPSAWPEMRASLALPVILRVPEPIATGKLYWP